MQEAHVCLKVMPDTIKRARQAIRGLSVFKDNPAGLRFSISQFRSAVSELAQQVASLQQIAERLETTQSDHSDPGAESSS